MAKKESTFGNMVITLFTVAFIAALALGGVYNLTKEPIAMAKKLKIQNAIGRVLPPFDTLITTKVLPSDGTDSLTFYKGIKDGQPIGTAIATYSNKGYDATQIQLMVGFLPNGKIENVEVVQQKETPGLGAKMLQEQFRGQFNGKNPKDFKLKVKKDSGDVDAITAATISSRAVCDALSRAYKAFSKENNE